MVTKKFDRVQLRVALSQIFKLLQSAKRTREPVKPVSLVGLPKPKYQFNDKVQWAFDSEDGNHYIDRGVVVGIVYDHPDIVSKSSKWSYYISFYEMPSDPHLPLPYTDLMSEDDLEPVSGK